MNQGLNDDTVAGLARKSSSERFAWEAYRRLLTMFGAIVLDIDREPHPDRACGSRSRGHQANSALGH